MFLIPINQYQKADWALFIICTDLECILEKIEACKIYNIRFAYSNIKQGYYTSFFNVCNIFV